MNTDFAKENAIEVIRQKADELRGGLELLVIDPMINIAIALSLYPEIAEKIKHIWFMGGAIKGGNVSTTAEFNIWVDPVAAIRSELQYSLVFRTLRLLC